MHARTPARQAPRCGARRPSSCPGSPPRRLVSPTCPPPGSCSSPCLLQRSRPWPAGNPVRLAVSHNHLCAELGMPCCGPQTAGRSSRSCSRPSLCSPWSPAELPGQSHLAGPYIASLQGVRSSARLPLDGACSRPLTRLTASSCSQDTAVAPCHSPCPSGLQPDSASARLRHALRHALSLQLWPLTVHGLIAAGQVVLRPLRRLSSCARTLLSSNTRRCQQTSSLKEDSATPAAACSQLSSCKVLQSLARRARCLRSCAGRLRLL